MSLNANAPHFVPKFKKKTEGFYECEGPWPGIKCKEKFGTKRNYNSYVGNGRKMCACCMGARFKFSTLAELSWVQKKYMS